MKRELTNPFMHTCCGCGLSHKVTVSINKKGNMVVEFIGDVKRSVKEGKRLLKKKN